MNREQMIDFMKIGICTLSNPTYVTLPKQVFISFGQWSPGMQEAAREIGRQNNFEMEMESGWHICGDSSNQFSQSCAYRLRSDYQDKPAEPEYEYREIFIKKFDYVYEEPVTLFERYCHSAISMVRFLGYAKTRDQKDNFAQTFTPDMKFVVLKKA